MSAGVAGVGPAEEWARKVVRRGLPARTLPIEERAEAFEDLAAAYGVLADLAHQAGDTDRYLSLSELQEHTDRISRELRPPQDPWAR